MMHLCIILYTLYVGLQDASESFVCFCGRYCEIHAFMCFIFEFFLPEWRPWHAGSGPRAVFLDPCYITLLTGMFYLECNAFIIHYIMHYIHSTLYLPYIIP